MRSESLQLAGVSKTFGKTLAVSGVDLTVTPGRLLTLLGPSGCGKTTLLRIVAGFLAPTTGRVLIGGRDIVSLPPNRRDIGIVFQNYALFPHLTVSDNVAFGLRVRGIGAPSQRKRVDEVLSLLQLEALHDRYPAQLSGGQQQRVALARALAIEPKLLLLDEPLSALDKNLRHSVQQELRSLQRRVGVTTIVVTHDQDEAFALADLVAVMELGRVSQLGEPQAIYDRPANGFVATFLGIGNMVPGSVVGHDRGDWVVDTPAGGRTRVPMDGMSTEIGAKVNVFFRPERVGIGAARSGEWELDASLVEARSMGPRRELECVLSDGTRVLATLPNGMVGGPSERGDQVRLAISERALTCLVQ